MWSSQCIIKRLSPVEPTNYKVNLLTFALCIKTLQALHYSCKIAVKRFSVVGFQQKMMSIQYYFFFSKKWCQRSAHFSVKLLQIIGTESFQNMILAVRKNGLQSLDQGSPAWCPQQQVTHKDHVDHPRACSKNNINMINVFTLMNINTKIIESKLSKILISEVCIKLVALRVITRSSSLFQKDWWPLV